MTDEELRTGFVAELKELEDSGAGLPYVFTPTQAYMLLAALQLVMRHPAAGQGRGPCFEFAEGLAKNIESRLCQRVHEGELRTPALAELARRGWDESYDGTAI